MAGSLDCWYGSFTLTGLDLASWCPPLSMGARVIDIVARYRVFRSLLLSRLACVVYSFISQSLTVLALIDRDVTFFQGRNSVAFVWDLLISYDSLVLPHSFNSFLHSLYLSAIQVITVVSLRCLNISLLHDIELGCGGSVL